MKPKNTTSTDNADSVTVNHIHILYVYSKIHLNLNNIVTLWTSLLHGVYQLMKINAIKHGFYFFPNTVSLYVKFIMLILSNKILHTKVNKTYVSSIITVT